MEKGIKTMEFEIKKRDEKTGDEIIESPIFGIDTIFPISKNYEKLGRCRWKEKRNVKWRQSARQITGMQRLRRAPIYFEYPLSVEGEGGFLFFPELFTSPALTSPSERTHFPFRAIDGF